MVATKAVPQDVFADVLFGLAPEQARLVRSKFKERSLVRGSTLYAQGEFPDAIYLVSEGRVRHSVGDVTIRVAGAGDLAGISDIFLPGRRTSATCLEGVHTFSLPTSVLFELMLSIPQLGVNLMGAANKMTLLLIDRIASYSGSWAMRRLALVLLDLSTEGEPVVGGFQLRAGVTHEFLASMIGSARETVTLALKKLKADGAITQKGRVLTVVPEKLREISEQKEGS